MSAINRDNPLGLGREEITFRQQYNQMEARCVKAESEVIRLSAILNTPELIDFPKAVTLEAQHQLLKWGVADRAGKTPQDWFWLIGYLAGRALEHQKEADRVEEQAGPNAQPGSIYGAAIAYHREKAVHHTITVAAALSHWHASIVGKATAMRPGHAEPAE